MKIHVVERIFLFFQKMLRLVAKKNLNGDCMNNLFSQNNFVYAVTSWQLTDKYKIFARQFSEESI